MDSKPKLLHLQCMHARATFFVRNKARTANNKFADNKIKETMQIALIRKLLAESRATQEAEYLVLKLQERVPSNVTNFAQFVTYLETRNAENIKRKKFLAIKKQVAAQLSVVIENYNALCAANNVVAENIKIENFTLVVRNK